MIRLGLCCLFRDQPIRFRTTTAKHLSTLSNGQRIEKLVAVVEANIQALESAINFCSDQGIGDFRVNSQILPLYTHPELGWSIDQLPGGQGLRAAFETCGALAQKRGVRLTFHPDQFVVLSSPRPRVVDSSIAELEYQAMVAEWIGADVLNVHGGGAYGDPAAALRRFGKAFERLSGRVRDRLTVENDDRIYTPQELLPLCEELELPLVYDVHHHRVHADDLDVEEATRQALATWDREPVVHVSSPVAGWDGNHPERHHDLLDPADFPEIWADLDLTVEVEAKAKEVAVLGLASALRDRGVELWGESRSAASRLA